MRRTWLSALALVVSTASARAATFDAEGHLAFDHEATLTQGFEKASAADLGVTCENTCTFESVESGSELALEGKRFVRLSTQDDGFEADIALPKTNGSYVFRLWVRHARVWGRVVFEHDESSGRGTEVAYLFPTGRVTSDGWVELASNPASVSGGELTRSYLRIDATNVDIDGFEAVPAGSYEAGGTCLGAFDPVCGPEAACVAERCRQGARFVPPLPPAAYRQEMARYLAARIRYFFGGRLSRTEYMPKALASMDAMLTAETPWQYWSAFARGVRLLHDWHTSASSAFANQGGPRRLGLCFIEGKADLSQGAWPSQAGRSDILVSHVGPTGALGLVAGDRLVAIDGLHPIDWVRSLVEVTWGIQFATDPDVSAELVEGMRDFIPRLAKTISVIRCDPNTLVCSDTIETISVTDMETDVQPPSCDNRPSYHLENPPENTPGDITTYHYVPFFPWRDLVKDQAPGENIYGMTFDNLYGTAQGLTPFFHDSNQFFKDNARGVILDHRAGNGGTVDAPEAITELVRLPEDLSVGPAQAMVAGFDGPTTPAEATALVQSLLKAGVSKYQVGNANADLALPVALIIHRDGSASDWLPHGMKGAPNVRVFGPHETAGAFSTYYQYSYWSRFEFQIASGDTYMLDGTPMIGHGIAPDEIVEHTQTSLLKGQDAPYEAALAWVRAHLK